MKDLISLLTMLVALVTALPKMLSSIHRYTSQRRRQKSAASQNAAMRTISKSSRPEDSGGSGWLKWWTFWYELFMMVMWLCALGWFFHGYRAATPGATLSGREFYQGMAMLLVFIGVYGQRRAG